MTPQWLFLFEKGLNNLLTNQSIKGNGNRNSQYLDLLIKRISFWGSKPKKDLIILYWKVSITKLFFVFEYILLKFNLSLIEHLVLLFMMSLNMFFHKTLIWKSLLTFVTAVTNVIEDSQKKVCCKKIYHVIMMNKSLHQIQNI